MAIPELPKQPKFTQSGDTVLETVYIYDKLYVKELQSDNATLAADKTKFVGDIDLDTIHVETEFSLGLKNNYALIFANVNDNKVGIGTTVSYAKLDVVGDVKVSENIKVNTDYTNSEVDVDLAVGGAIKVGSFIVDSDGNRGENTNFLSMDGGGITWVEFEPSFTEGIFIQDESEYVGLGKSFTVLNFVNRNSLGVGSDTSQATDSAAITLELDNAKTTSLHTPTGIKTFSTLEEHGLTVSQTFSVLNVNETDLGTFTVNTIIGDAATSKTFTSITNQELPNAEFIRASNTTGLATIFTNDLWGFSDNETDSNISVYRMTNVGVMTNNPLVPLQIGASSDTDENVVAITSGRIGIGTTSPRYNLDIEGDSVVSGLVTFNNKKDSTSTTTGALVVSGGVGIGSNVYIGKSLDVNSTTDSESTSTGALTVSGGAGIAKTLHVGGKVKVSNTEDATDKDTGALVVEGGVGIEKKLFVGTDAIIGGTLELQSTLKDKDNSTASTKTDYRLSATSDGTKWRPSGVETERTIWVSMSGHDSNSGLLEGDAKRTIGAAAEIADTNDTIIVRPGFYDENNPIGLRTDVTVTGQDLRLVTVRPQNLGEDIFHVRRGCLIENLNFACKNPQGQSNDGGVSVSNAGGAAVAFPPPSGSTSGYTNGGPATPGPTGRWRSPYVRNCTNFMTDSIGMKIDGDHATNLKSMVCDSFTQYNQNGVGVSISNSAYAQLVSIFTINCNIGIYADTGGQCDLTNSNSSFGNFGLVAAGVGSTEYTGFVSVTSADVSEIDTIVAYGVTDLSNSVSRPYDGQVLWFKTGSITEPAREVFEIKLLTDANAISQNQGFTDSDPPSVIIRDADGTVEPKGPQGIVAEATATILEGQSTISEINLVNTGRNYLSSQNLVVDIEGNLGIATVVTKPIYFTVSSSTVPTPVVGLATITLNEFVPYELSDGDSIEFRRISRILTSSHSFEYVGAGVDINTSTPFEGALPIKANEVVATDGAQIPFSSTDQAGNFDIGEGIQINQTTSTITGRDFSRSVQAEITPLIIALR